MGDTPLRAACKEGHVAAAALLIEKGADINNRIKVMMIYLILNKGVHCYWYHFYSQQSGRHALYRASFEGKLEIVKLLLDHGAQIDLPSNVSYHCNMYYQCSLAMHMIVSLMYICTCIPLILMFVTHAG